MDSNSAQVWWLELGGELVRLGFERCDYDWGMYYRPKTAIQQPVMLLAYVDDLLIAAKQHEDARGIAGTRPEGVKGAQSLPPLPGDLYRQDCHQVPCPWPKVVQITFANNSGEPGQRVSASSIYGGDRVLHVDSWVYQTRHSLHRWLLG
jgi:hypothetical protein